MSFRLQIRDVVKRKNPWEDRPRVEHPTSFEDHIQKRLEEAFETFSYGDRKTVLMSQPYSERRKETFNLFEIMSIGQGCGEVSDIYYTLERN